MAIEGWGKDPWGTGIWAGVVPAPPLVLDSAVAISTKEVEVTFNRDPQIIAPTADGDALNPNTWVIQRLDDGFFFSILGVLQTEPLKIVINVLQDFGPSTVQHRVLSTTLLDSEGNPISSPPLNSADFAGILAAEAKDAPTRARNQSNAIRDIANPPVPPNVMGTNVGGTLVINSAGDYELESGNPLLKKLIIRRLITLRGGFFHLPDYGVGLGSKELLPAANLIQLRAEIIRQIQREPEVEDASVRLLLGTQNDLTVRIGAKLRASEDPLSFSLQLSSDGLVL